MLPAGLVDLPPGPQLAAVLAGIDPDAVTGFESVLLLRAQARQANHEQARLLACLALVTHCPDAETTDRVSDITGLPDGTPGAVDEVAFALTWTTCAAGRQVRFATDVVQRYPAVHAAFDAGVIDWPKAKVLVDEVTGLDDETARRVQAGVLPKAPGWTTGQLRARLRRLVLTADPAAARRRREEGVRKRRVVRHLEEDGTATLTALGLPVEQAAKASNRLDALALAAKQAGDDRTLDQLRADTMLDLIAGTLTVPEPAARRGVLDIVAPLDTLRGLADEPGEIQGWGPLAAEVLHQLATRGDLDPEVWRVNVVDADGNLVGVVDARRRPTARQARHVQARDRTCRAPGCRVPARRCDLDHTVAHRYGGLTVVGNLGPACRRHHVGKHERGLRVEQPEPGTFVWTTRRGHRYTRHQEHPFTEPSPGRRSAR